MTESTLTKNIVRRLKKLPYCQAFKIHGGPHQHRGLSDIIGCYRGIAFWFEVKLPGKERTLTKLQAKKLRDIRKAGGIAKVITSYEEAEWALRQRDSRRRAA